MVSWWKACAENRHFLSFLGMLTNSFCTEKVTVTFIHVKRLTQYLHNFLKEPSENVVIFSASQLSINVYIIVQDPEVCVVSR